MNDVTTYAKDLAERMLWTFVQAFCSTLAVAQLSNFDQVKNALVAAGIAGGAAILSLVKGVFAGTKTGTAATLRRQAFGAAAEVGGHVLNEGVAALEKALGEADAIAPVPAAPAPEPEPPAAAA